VQTIATRVYVQRAVCVGHDLAKTAEPIEMFWM